MWYTKPMQPHPTNRSPTTQPSVERVPIWDNLRFILMGLVVFGHSLELAKGVVPLAQYVYTYLYAFHIPLFVFLSGHLSKPELSHGDYFKILSKIILPYAVAQLLYLVMGHFLWGTFSVSPSFLLPYRHLWFFVSLVLWRLLLPLFLQVRGAFVISVVIAILVGYSDAVGGFLSLSRTFVFFPFFILGHLTRQHHIERWRSRPGRAVALLVLLIAAVVIAHYRDDIPYGLFFGKYSYAGMGWQEMSAGLYRLAFIAVACLMGAAVIILTPTRRLAITGLGTRTAYSYILHMIPMVLAAKFNFFGVLQRLSHAPFLLVAELAVFTIVVHVFLSSKPVAVAFRVIAEPPRRFVGPMLAAVFVIVAVLVYSPTLLYFGVPQIPATDIAALPPTTVVSQCGSCRPIPPRGLVVRFAPKQYSDRLEMSLNGGCVYQLRYFQNNMDVGTATLDLRKSAASALATRTVALPQWVRSGGLDELLIVPSDNRNQVIGHLQ